MIDSSLTSSYKLETTGSVLDEINILDSNRGFISNMSSS
jgi:hypothetical protein